MNYLEQIALRAMKLTRVPFLSVDHRPRIEFYVKEGLVPRVPTDQQLARGIAEWATGIGVLGQLLFYSKNPKLLFPTQAKQRFVDNPRTGGDKTPYYDNEREAELMAARSAKPVFDRFLHKVALFAPTHALMKTWFNPWEVIPASGLNAATGCVIAHTVHTNHPPPALWDLQLIHPDVGGLDRLERQVDQALMGKGLRARIDRAIGCKPGQFEDLKELIPRVRRFDYPPMPKGVSPMSEDLVSFLCHAVEL